jgi:hypothetical protein
MRKGSSKLIILAAVTSLMMGCATSASKDSVNTAGTKSTDRAVATMHVEDSDSVLNMGKGVVLKLTRDLNIKPNTSKHILVAREEMKPDFIVLNLVNSKNYDREIKAGEFFEIESVDWQYDAKNVHTAKRKIYTFKLRNNAKIVDITFTFINPRVGESTRDMTIGYFKGYMSENNFEVIQPGPAPF